MFVTKVVSKSVWGNGWTEGKGGGKRKAPVCFEKETNWFLEMLNKDLNELEIISSSSAKWLSCFCSHCSVLCTSLKKKFFPGTLTEWGRDGSHSRAHKLCLKFVAVLGRCELNPDLFYSCWKLVADLFLLVDTHLCQMLLGNSFEECFGICACTHWSTEPFKKGRKMYLNCTSNTLKIEGISWMLANLVPITNVQSSARSETEAWNPPTFVLRQFFSGFANKQGQLAQAAIPLTSEISQQIE